VEKFLSYIIFLPLVVAVVLGLFRVPLKVVKTGALISSAVILGMVCLLIANFDPSLGMQFVRIAPWIKSYGITYFVGVDAISLVILFLISLLMFLLYLYMWDEKQKGYWYNMLLLQTGVTGALLSLDLILFYLFWETMLLPIFILIGRYGHEYSLNSFNAMKIILMTVMGSMSMLLAILYIGYRFFEKNGFWSFALNDLSSLSLDPTASVWLVGGFLLAFAIKIPLVGFHTWMAPAYSSSPTPSTVILSAIMAKLGIYGLWRFGYELFERTLDYYAPFIIALAVIGVVFYAIHAIMEDNLKRMFAFSSGAHLSMIALGLFLTNIYAWSGSLYLIATHALASGGIFIMIGFLAKRIKTVSIKELGGIASSAPKFAFFFLFFALCIAGVPSTGGFVGELLIIIGAFKHHIFLGFFASLSMLGSIMYLFWMMQRVLYSKVKKATVGFEDLNIKEIFILLPLALLLLISGLAPSLFTPLFDPQLNAMLKEVALKVGGTL